MKVWSVLWAVLLASLSPLTAYAGDNPNSLAVGNASKVKGALNIPINPVAEFNWKTREQVMDMRRDKINKFPQLISSPYKPYPPIWAAVEDKRPWWGTSGSCVWGAGPRSIEGPAEESRYILNPFLLVGVNPSTLQIWDPSKLKKADLSNPNFPYFWYPESLTFLPGKSYATAIYNITKFQKDIAATGALKNQGEYCNRFSLVAYNARDFGYNYIWLNQGRSINVTNDNHAPEPVFIRQMLHCGGTCRYDANGCNNMSPFTKEIDRLRFSSLPARAVVYLWREEPPTLKTKPDFMFVIDFK
ncbi:MAG: hypothetical protein K2W95_04370 [Candidatus Obscuribacterales bacterium]|nr:hypothetical protein [Candidatus Obscuribacterales bacterium]